MTRAAADLPPIRSARPAVTADPMARTGLEETLPGDLVHRLHARVRADAVPDPIFAERIEDRGPHRGRMVSVRSSVALTSGRYHGAPVPKHADLPVRRAHSGRWRALFRESGDEIGRRSARLASAGAPRASSAHGASVRESQAAPDAVPVLR